MVDKYEQEVFAYENYKENTKETETFFDYRVQVYC